jgi:glycosyltransferase involved in cell wall biosynthesis
MPRVTVLIPNYNNARYLGQCLEAVVAQTYGDWAAVVADNASTDDSLTVAASFRDSRLRLVRRRRTVSMMANLNLLVSEIDSEYAVILTADDWWEPQFLDRLVPLLDEHPESILAASAIRIVRDGREVEVLGLHQLRGTATGGTCPPEEALRLLITKRNRLYLPAILARRELFERMPGFEDSLVCDWIMLVRAAFQGSFQLCPDVLANYRQHDASLTAAALESALWGLELVRAVRVLQRDWADGGTPLAGASRTMARTFTIKLLVEARRLSHAGDRPGARLYCGLARTIAPTTGLRGLCLWCERALHLLTSAPLAPLGRRLLGRLGAVEEGFRGRY